MWLLIWVELSYQTKVFYISKYQIKKYIVIVYKYIAQYQKKKIQRNKAKAKKQSTVYYIAIKKKKLYSIVQKKIHRNIAQAKKQSTVYYIVKTTNLSPIIYTLPDMLYSMNTSFHSVLFFKIFFFHMLYSLWLSNLLYLHSSNQPSILGSFPSSPSSS